MGSQQGGLAEVVAMAAGQVDDIVETGGGVKFLAQLLIGGGAADEGLQGGERHGQRASEGLCILAGQGSPAGRLPLPCKHCADRIDGEGTFLP